jgi:hypothetical protein
MKIILLGYMGSEVYIAKTLVKKLSVCLFSIWTIDRRKAKSINAIFC